jgi:hypothetical protein
MQNMNERPICHRAEDLVTYLYGEATAEEARDFAGHLQQCDACRAEFTVFNQVHDSIFAWRNEALGSAVAPTQEISTQSVFGTTDVVQHERKLSALAALREFFNVSPFWLRGATAIAGLLLCALLVFAVARIFRQPAQVASGNQLNVNQQEFDRAVQKEVEARMAEMARNQRPELEPPKTASVPNDEPRPQVANHRARSKSRPAKLTREETEQLAADLGLIPGREEELPFVLPDEPNQ